MESESLNFAEALRALESASAFGVNPSLENVERLAEVLCRPQDAFSSVQVAGTNGKTSTARLAAALLRAEGRHVGLYTSPHLHSFTERFEIDGGAVGEADFARSISAALWADGQIHQGGGPEHPRSTQFELLTMAALWLFREQRVEIAVLEVGMGGRWDATSVVAPSVAVITGVALDHVDVLGTTLEQIATEKAAIIKPASAPVLGPGTDGLDSIFLRRSDEAGAHPRAVRADIDFSPAVEDLTARYRVKQRPTRPMGCTVLDIDGVHARYGDLTIAAPSYQAANVATAVTAAEAALGRALAVECVRAALTAVKLPARFEVARARPPLIIDGSHNPEAAAVLAAAIREAFPDPTTRPAVLLGVLADKDAHGIVAALAPVATGFAVTAPLSPRALAADELAAIVEDVTGRSPRRYGSVAEALFELASSDRGGLLVTGSLVTAGEAREAVLGASVDSSETREM